MPYDGHFKSNLHDKREKGQLKKYSVLGFTEYSQRHSTRRPVCTPVRVHTHTHTHITILNSTNIGYSQCNGKSSVVEARAVL